MFQFRATDGLGQPRARSVVPPLGWVQPYIADMADIVLGSSRSSPGASCSSRAARAAHRPAHLGLLRRVRLRRRARLRARRRALPRHRARLGPRAGVRPDLRGASPTSTTRSPSSWPWPAFGFAIGSGLVVALGIDWNWVAVLVGVAIGAVLGLVAVFGNLPMIVLVVISSFAGAVSVVGGLMLSLRLARLRRLRVGSVHGHRRATAGPGTCCSWSWRSAASPPRPSRRP